MININKVITGKWRENCYLVNDSNKTTLIIDPGNDFDKIQVLIETNGLIPGAIFNTHAHYDHIGAVKQLKKKYSIPFYLHSKEIKLLRAANFYLNLFEGDIKIQIPTVEYNFDKIDNPTHLEEIFVRIIFTPGHTEGGVCLLIENHLFSGDTLLKGKASRIDLPGGDKTALIDSLNQLSKLSGKIIVHPGHGDSMNLSDQVKYTEAKYKVIS